MTFVVHISDLVEREVEIEVEADSPEEAHDKAVDNYAEGVYDKADWLYFTQDVDFDVRKED